MSNGQFDTNLQTASQQLGTTSFENATSSAVSIATTPLSPTQAPTAVPASSSSSSSSSNGLGAGAIAGIAIGGLAVAVLMGLAIWYFAIRKEADSGKGTATFENPIRRSSVEIIQDSGFA